MNSIDLGARRVGLVVNISPGDLETFEIEAERKGIAIDSVVARVLAEGARKLRQGKTVFFKNGD